MSGHNIPDETFKQLCKEYQGWLLALLLEQEEIINKIANNDVSADEVSVLMMRDAHNIKGASGSYGFSTISAIAHRYEDYLNAALTTQIHDNVVEDLFVFIDQMRALGEMGSEPREDVSDAMLRRLPIFKNTQQTGVPQSVDLDTLIICSSNTVSSIARMVFEQSGMRVSDTRLAIEGLTLAITTKPDIIIFTRVLDVISGIDLAGALNAMPRTNAAELVLITSAHKDHPDLKLLPKEVHVVFESSQMASDLVTIAKKTIDEKLSA